MLGANSGEMSRLIIEIPCRAGKELAQNQYKYKYTYQIIVADAADAVSVNFSGRCKFLQI